MFARYGLTDAHRFSDPSQQLYRAFELRRATLRQVFGWHVWQRGLEAFSQGHGIGLLAGDAFQMPGVFLLRDGQVLREFRHATAADRPDYATLAQDSIYD